ncbi:MAG TPA: hypothetical protein VD741_01085 [Solirubrobacterales bacterium]|nr:hypothetical protein [Solirubrobacterales bacterium]
MDHLERFIEEGQSSVAIAVGIGLVLLQIPGIQDVGEEIGLDSSRELLIGVGALLLTSILLELRQLKRKMSPVITGRQHYSDPNEMYNALREKAAELTDPEHFEIEVMGLTLYSAWPQLEPFLEGPGVDRWTVRLATIAEDGTGALQWVPKTWPTESATTVAQVEEFRSRRGRDHHHTIEIYEYDFAPAVHGFRLGNGDVFISTLRWREEGRLGKHRFPYDYVPAHDVSPEADAARALFKSWFEQAMLNAQDSGRVNLGPG